MAPQMLEDMRLAVVEASHQDRGAAPSAVAGNMAWKSGPEDQKASEASEAQTEVPAAVVSLEEPKNSELSEQRVANP